LPLFDQPARQFSKRGNHGLGGASARRGEDSGGWAFYAFEREKPAEQIPVSAPCYSCHEHHAAVATTFIQFYPTLLPIAQEKKTLSVGYLKDNAAQR